jgi:hypothetical protein
MIVPGLVGLRAPIRKRSLAAQKSAAITRECKIRGDDSAVLAPRKLYAGRKKINPALGFGAAAK